jgi:8-oxo-dGTP pyrophosphatase MutT (NUDIX family)
MSEPLIGADLVERLSRYTPSDSDEREAVARVRQLLDGTAPFSAEFFDPGHITASAFVIHPRGHSIALILHSKIGRWLQPGGHVELRDATIVDAAVREVAEEIGVGPADDPWLCDVDVHAFPARHDVPEHLHHDVRVAFVSDSEHLVAADGADDARWWSLTDALALEESIARPARKLDVWSRTRR